MVPIKEMTDVMKVVKETAHLKPKTWVRLKRGVFKDDLAQVSLELRTPQCALGVFCVVCVERRVSRGVWCIMCTQLCVMCVACVERCVPRGVWCIMCTPLCVVCVAFVERCVPHVVWCIMCTPLCVVY